MAQVAAQAAKLRDRADGLGPLDREAGLDGNARVIDLHHLAGPSPAGAVAPALGVAVELAPPAWVSRARSRTRPAREQPTAFAAKLVEALGGLRRKFVADRVEAIKFAVRTFDLHGALPPFGF